MLINVPLELNVIVLMKTGEEAVSNGSQLLKNLSLAS